MGDMKRVRGIKVACDEVGSRNGGAVLCGYRWPDGEGPETVSVEPDRDVDSFLTKQRDDNLRGALRGYFT